MNTNKIYAESIAKEYAPKDDSKITALRKLDRKAKKSRLIGLGLGALQGVLSSMVIIVIIVGLVCTVNNVTDIILEQESDQLEELQATVEDIDTYVNMVAEDPVVSILDNILPVSSQEKKGKEEILAKFEQILYPPVFEDDEQEVDEE